MLNIHKVRHNFLHYGIKFRKNVTFEYCLSFLLLMKKNKRTILWIIMGVLILGILYVLYNRFFSKKGRLRELEAKGQLTPDETQELQTLRQSEYKPESFPLKQWMKGPNVMALQKKLNSSSKCQRAEVNIICNNKPLYPLDEDGMFGECTKKALVNCQGIFALNEGDYVQMMNPYITPQTGRSLSWA